MNDGFTWWLVVLGIAVGIGVVWLFTVRLPRDEADVGADELVDEAGWISGSIESAGGIAPQNLVHEVLELHRQYLAGEHGLAEPSDDSTSGAEPDTSGALPPAPEVDAPPAYLASPPPPPPPPPDRGMPSDQPASGVE